METKIDLTVDNPDLLVGLVEADGVRVSDSDGELRSRAEELAAARRDAK